MHVRTSTFLTLIYAVSAALKAYTVITFIKSSTERARSQSFFNSNVVCFIRKVLGQIGQGGQDGNKALKIGNALKRIREKIRKSIAGKR